jgi:hypothetical protein
MKNILVGLLIATLSIAGCFAQVKSNEIIGAWSSVEGEDQVVAICSDKYFSTAVYNSKSKTFKGTYGGSYRLEGNKLMLLFEFHSLSPEMIGKEVGTTVEMKNGKIVLSENNAEWTRIDNGTPGKLSGAWLITGRMEGTSMSKMTPGARRTMKILSGTRFQWIAYNVETKEFMGTGGGTYKTENGKYTETIEFFSRDNSRVGKSLAFDFKLEDGQWRHKGLSSKGEPIDEVWSKRESLGL